MGVAAQDQKMNVRFHQNGAQDRRSVHCNSIVARIRCGHSCVYKWRCSRFSLRSAMRSASSAAQPLCLVPMLKASTTHPGEL